MHLGSRLEVYYWVSTYRYIQVGSLTLHGIILGSVAALLQSPIYGGLTTGIFSILQGIGATAVISPVAAVIGSAMVFFGAII